MSRTAGNSDDNIDNFAREMSWEERFRRHAVDGSLFNAQLKVLVIGTKW